MDGGKKQRGGRSMKRKPKMDKEGDASEGDHSEPSSNVGAGYSATITSTGVKRQRTNTRLCRFLFDGKCKKGDSCEFSHVK